MLRLILIFFPILLMASSWAERELNQMTLDEKIGQLFVLPACPERELDHWADWLKLLKDCHIGGAIVKQSDPINQVKFLNQLQKESELLILVVADAEWGLAMRMKNTIAFPRNMTLGAIDDLKLVEQLGFEIGRQAKRVGIHMNLAPVADVNSNSNNPIIGMRSFGENPIRVAMHVEAMTKGMQSAGVFACVKHFPGHGDTDVDSHWNLPLISHSLAHLNEIEWPPFRKAIEGGVAAVMSAHLLVPSIDDLPTSLSKSCHNVLRNELGFQGLVITDALNMRALTKRFTPEEIAVNAKKAGADLLLYGDHKGPNVDEIMKESVPRAFFALKRAYEVGELSIHELDASVLRILEAKEGIQREVELENLMSFLHSEEAYALKKKLFQEAVTLIGEECFPIPKDATYIHFGEEDMLEKELPGNNPECFIVGVHGKLTKEALSIIESVKEKAIVLLFSSPYELGKLENVRSVLLAFESDEDAQYGVLNILKGNAPAKGHLPIH